MVRVPVSNGLKDFVSEIVIVIVGDTVPAVFEGVIVTAAVIELSLLEKS